MALSKFVTSMWCFFLHFLLFCLEKRLRTWDWAFHFLCQQVQQVFKVFRLNSWNMFILQSWSIASYHIVKVWQQPSSCSSLIFFPGPPTTEWDPPSLWVLYSFFSHNLDFITRRPLSLALSPGSLCLYLCHQEVLFNLIVCAVYLAASSLLATSVYMQVVNITSYIIRCQAMSVFLPWKKLFAVALLLPGPPWILSLSRSYCRLRELIFNWKRCWKTYFVVLLAMPKF